MRRFYVHCIRPFCKTPIARQRVQLLWFLPGYIPLLALPGLGLIARLRLFAQFLRVDWSLQHAHRPSEISAVCLSLASSASGCLVEAGCWKGGSTAKFSLVCKQLDRRLLVFDSFQGVEPLTNGESSAGYDFSGEYACSEEMVRANVQRYGALEVCKFTKGWFRDTLAAGALSPNSVAVGYVDCDVVRGTREALAGMVPALIRGAPVFTQDFEIDAVRAMLMDECTWPAIGLPRPRVNRLGAQLASLHFDLPESSRGGHSYLIYARRFVLICYCVTEESVRVIWLLDFHTRFLRLESNQPALKIEKSTRFSLESTHVRHRRHL